MNEDSARNTVSVIIPTVDRPALLRRAVNSALRQSHRPYEVIVVQDGSGGNAFCEIRDISDPRLVLTETGRPSHDAGATARNVGILTASGDWIAFLDDDDEWMANKLELQLEVARSWGTDTPVVISGKAERRAPDRSSVWPLRPKKPGESLSSYLFVRRYEGEGWLPTPTLLTQRKTARDNLFLTGMRQHEDLDWMLRLEAAGVEFVVLDAVLAIVHVEDPNSLSSTASWRESLQWANERRGVLGSTGYSAFCLTEVSRLARRDGAPSGFFAVMISSLRGRPRARDLLQFAGTWLLPESLRGALSGVRRRRGGRLAAG